MSIQSSIERNDRTIFNNANCAQNEYNTGQFKTVHGRVTDKVSRTRTVTPVGALELGARDTALPRHPLAQRRHEKKTDREHFGRKPLTCNSALSISQWDLSSSKLDHSCCMKCNTPGMVYFTLLLTPPPSPLSPPFCPKPPPGCCCCWPCLPPLYDPSSMFSDGKLNGVGGPLI